jgi:iron(III) transport system substrate-binding protein
LRQYLVIALLAAVMHGCRGESPEVVLYVSADEHIARQVIDAFEHESGVRVRFVGDIEAKKSTGLVERLRAERDQPQADVFWSSEPFMTILLAKEGVLAPHASAVTRDWPRERRDEQRRWFEFAARARVIVYAPDRIAPDDRPVTWMDLTDDRFRGRIVLADPRFGTTGGHLGAMLVYWSREVAPGYYEAFLEGLAANGARLLPGGNAGVVEAVVRGEADLGFTDTDDVWAAQASGHAVDLIYARHGVEARDARPDGGGPLLIPNTVARVAGGPNPASASRLIDFLLSERVERMLAESASRNIPLSPAVARDFGQLAVADPLEVDLERVAAVRATAVEVAMNYLGGTRGDTGAGADAR